MSSRTVRFEDSCHLIPDSSPSSSKSSRLPKLVTRSISVPIWKASPSKSPTSPASPESPKPFSLTVPLPSFSMKHFSPARTQYPTTSCLATRPRGFSDSNPSPSSDSTAPIPHSNSRPRRLSFPQVVPYSDPFASPSSSSSSSSPVATVPLRPCCEACYSGVDAALAQEHWTFQWSSAAARKHSQSLSGRTPFSPSIFPWKPHTHHDHHNNNNNNNNKGNQFAVVCEEGEET